MWRILSANRHSQEMQSRVASAFDQMDSREDLGFKDLSLLKEAIDQVNKLVAFMPIRKKIVVIGMGGSSLGAKALVDVALPGRLHHQIHFMDNIDSGSILRFLENAEDPSEITWVVTSKSGRTIETLSLFDFCLQYFEKKNSFDISKNTIVVTERSESPLFEFSQNKGCPFLEVPKSIGGRYSAFTPVGLLPLALLGARIEKVMDGCHWVMKNLEVVEDLSKELATSLALGEHSFYLFGYADGYVSFGDWAQQLWAESLAKAVTRDLEPGPQMSLMIPCRGVSDQHSILQQMVEGREKKFVCFLRERAAEKFPFTLEKSQFNNELMVGKNLGALMTAEADATRDALLDKGVRSISLFTDKLELEEVSALMMMWMLAVSTLGEAFDIDAFNQPGVESGKSLARRVLGGSD